MDRQQLLRLVLALLIAGFGAINPAQALEDHPLMTRYEGSTIDKSEVEEFGQYKLATAIDKKGEPSGQTLEGRVTRIVYQNPKERSTLEIFRNYRNALEKAGITMLFTCETDQCGPGYARSAWNRYNGLFAAADGDPRYLSGRIDSEAGTAYVALMVGRNRTQLDVVEIQGMQEALVAANADALAEGIDRDGRVSVYGIYFDTDKSVVKPESKAALDEIAKLLKSRPELKLYVVGHTDMTSTYEHNQALSEARARAVVQALVDGYGIAASRLEGHGVGPLAPAATNATIAGRARNRRVELVAR